MTKQEYSRAYSAFRLLMREIRLGHDRRFKGRRDATKALAKLSIDTQKMLNKTWNLAQEAQLEREYGERYWFHIPAYALAIWKYKHDRTDTDLSTYSAIERYDGATGAAIHSK
jgi:hypothetical protein